MQHDEFDKLMETIPSDNSDVIWLHQENMDIGGGEISIDDINRINQYDNTDTITISGLRQDTFEYFIERYGDRITYLYLWKNKLVEDFSALSRLTKVRYIDFFGNQRVTKLWDMSSNHCLEGLAFNDFSRLRSLDGIQNAPNLKHLHFGNKVWATSILSDLEPLAGTKLISFSFGGKKIEREDISVYARMPELKVLDFATNLYTTEILAQIVAMCPDVSGYALVPYRTFDASNREKDVLICGKGKPFLHSKKDMEKIEGYKKKFYDLVRKYKNDYLVLETEHEDRD